MLSKRVINGVKSRNDETPPIATPTTARSTVYGRWSRSAAGWTTLARTRNPAMTKVMLATWFNCRFRRPCQGVTTGDGPRHARFYEPLFRLNYVALPPRPKPARRRSAPMSWRTISLRLRGRVGTRSCCGSNSAGRPMGKSANTSPPFARTRARARGGSENQRPWPADKVERWSIDRLIPYAKNAPASARPHACSRTWKRGSAEDYARILGGNGRTGPIASKNCAVVACQSSMQQSPPVHRRGSGACPDTRRSNELLARLILTHSVFPDSMSLPKLNPVEPPWYGPVCPVVGEGWHREVSPYPDRCPHFGHWP